MTMPGFYAESSLYTAIDSYQARVTSQRDAPSSANVVQPAGPIACATCHMGCGGPFNFGCHLNCEAWCHFIPF
jgi:hypothetical protein